MKKILILAKVIIAICVVVVLGAYIYLLLSLPQLEGQIETDGVAAHTAIERDRLGTAVITATNRGDAAYALGFAHAQDRLFQMDLLRRNAAGELSEIVGEAALDIDIERRFHQFRKRAEKIVAQLPPDQQGLLDHYARGVNDGRDSLMTLPFEYRLTGTVPKPWLPEDSLLVTFSMYIDLQLNQVKRDFALTAVQNMFGADMVNFLVQPSEYQAALDDSRVPVGEVSVPSLSPVEVTAYRAIKEPAEVGSNNWAVSGQLTESGHAMLSDDMHLGLRVPVIWYRAQLNYSVNDQQVQVTGVSLPGAPLIVVGTNNHVAWGFTNANLDNVDWVLLSDGTETWQEQEIILVGEREQPVSMEMSRYGPVRRLNGLAYALVWVAHQPYAVNLGLLGMEQVKSVSDARAVAEHVGIPVQNMMLADADGNIAWKAAGAVTARTQPGYVAIPEKQYSSMWDSDEPATPFVENPAHGRLWTGNSRVVGAADLLRYGDGGYALGARAQQIRDRLFETDSFSETTFYQIQLDNEARFLRVWHELLTDTLKQRQNTYEEALKALAQWQDCACANSIGYTLVRRFRTTVIEQLLAPVEQRLSDSGLTLSPVLRHVEPAIWQLLNEQPADWLPSGNQSWQEFLLSAYDLTRIKLADEHQHGLTETLEGLSWGEVNALAVKHPFAAQIPLIGSLLNMPTYAGFGDSFMPAVQGPEFGASQRLIVQPGREQDGILTVPGGQSGHPLSDFYSAGFDEYAEHANTPLLPGEPLYRLLLVP